MAEVKLVYLDKAFKDLYMCTTIQEVKDFRVQLDEMYEDGKIKNDSRVFLVELTDHKIALIKKEQQ